MKRYILIIGYWLLIVALSAQTTSEQKIIQEMTAAAERIKTIQCEFTQTRYMKMLSKEQVSKGKMFCQQPDKLRWEYVSPKASALIMDGANVRMTKSDTGNESRNKFVGEMARMIMNSVAGKCLTDSKSFLVSAQETPTEYVASLLPQKKEMKRMYTKLVLHFDLKQSTVTEIEMYEKSGDRTVIELRDIRINER